MWGMETISLYSLSIMEAPPKANDSLVDVRYRVFVLVINGMGFQLRLTLFH